MKTATKAVWCCQECGHSQVKWSGQCPACKEWNSLVEEVPLPPPSHAHPTDFVSPSKPVPLSKVEIPKLPRIPTEIRELDRVLGGGVVPGSLTLVGGDPGIGKSTLLMQTSFALAEQQPPVLYICGEESVEQTSMRAKRLGIAHDSIYLLNETNLAVIKQHIDQLNPKVIVVDSIQILYTPDQPSAPGSVSQVRNCSTEFMHIAKQRGISIFLIGHVTKSGELAGPRVLEHIVDTVLYFEGDKHLHYRILRAVKNRFGATDEIAVFSMTGEGLNEVTSPSQIFLSEYNDKASRSIIGAPLEGSRPLLVDIQALVTDTVFSTPSRKSTGLDHNRLSLLLAVLEKRMKYQMHRSDVFVSIAGGLKVTEPSIDLGILLAIAASFSNREIPNHTVAIGEVGLSGEIRSVPRLEARLKEALHMGFEHCVIPKLSKKGISKELSSQLSITTVSTVEEAIHAVIPS